MILILGDYYLLANGYIESHQLCYHIIQAAGSLGLSVDLFKKRAWPALIMQIIFIFIAAWTITRFVL